MSRDLATIKHALVSVTVSLGQLSFSVDFVTLPLASVPISILIDNASLARFLVLLEIAFIFVTSGVHFHASSLLLITKHLAFKAFTLL